MPIVFRAVVAFNIVASIVVVFVAYSFGGGFSSTPFPPDRELVLELIEPAPAPAPSSPEHAPRSHPAFEVPAQFSRPEPMAARWQTLPDGTVRFLD